MDNVQDIKFRVSAETKQAEKALDDTTKKLQKLAPTAQMSNFQLQSMTRIVQDMPYGFFAVGNNITMLTDQMAMASAQGVGFGAMLKGMASSMMGPGGIAFGIAAITSLITYFSGTMASGKGALDEFSRSVQNAIDKLIEFQDPFKKIKFQFSPEQATNAISLLNKEIEKLEQTSRQRQIDIGVSGGVSPQAFDARILTKQITEEEKNRNKENELLLEKFRGMKVEYEAQLRIAKLLEEVGGTKVNKERISALESEKKQIDLLVASYSSLIEGIRQASIRGALNKGMNIPDIFGMTGVKVGKRGDGSLIENAGEQLREEMWLTEGMIITTAQVMEREFIVAWENIFGEANSLFEKLVASWSQLLFERVTKNAFGMILDLIPGGGFLGDLLGLNGRAGMANGTVVQLNIDGREFAQAVVNGNAKATKLRLSSQ